MRTSCPLLVFLVAVCLGCNEGSPPPGGPALPANTAANDSGGPPPPVAPPAAPVLEKASDELTTKGIAGQKMGKGVLATPASVYLRIPDRLVFMNVEHAKNLYKEQIGALPKTHEDFMREIIEANNIQLPELPYESHYIYVPEKEELMIEHRPM